jgi:hypothetical protein
MDPFEAIVKVSLTESSRVKFIMVFSSEKKGKMNSKSKLKQGFRQLPESLSVTLICNSSFPTSTFSGTSIS